MATVTDVRENRGQMEIALDGVTAVRVRIVCVLSGKFPLLDGAVLRVDRLRIVGRGLQCNGRNAVFVKSDQVSVAVNVFDHAVSLCL